MVKKIFQELVWRTFPYYMYRVYKAYRSGDAVPVPHKLKIRTIEHYATAFGLKTFVETGTYRGDTVAATAHHFTCIHSIELSKSLAAKAKTRFSNMPQITIHDGDSAHVLPALLSALDSSCLFWLDAHYSAGITARGALDSPIVQELDTIFSRNEPGDVILIDDAREFTGRGGYPTMEELFEHVRAARPGWRFLAYNDIIRIWNPGATAQPHLLGA